MLVQLVTAPKLPRRRAAGAASSPRGLGVRAGARAVAVCVAAVWVCAPPREMPGAGGDSWDAALAFSMSLSQAWRVLGVGAEDKHQAIKKAFRTKIREVHPDVVHDNGEKLEEVREAFKVANAVTDPSNWDGSKAHPDDLPEWARGLLQGVQWTEDCQSYADFLSKPDHKALAVGELDMVNGVRPWAAAWGKWSSSDATSEAMRLCKQQSKRCRMIYVGDGPGRARNMEGKRSPEDEKRWWDDQLPRSDYSFGFLPEVDKHKERIVGYKVIEAGLEKKRVRVPVFRPTGGGVPYYYDPTRPTEKVCMQKANFKYLHAGKARRNKREAKDIQKRQGYGDDQWANEPKMSPGFYDAHRATQQGGW